MTHRADPGLFVASPRRRPRQRRPRLLLALGVVAVVIAITAAAVSVVRGSAAGDLVGSIRVTASSSAVGSSPGDVIPHPGSRAGGWRSANETVGAWIELAWPTGQELHRLTLTRGPLERPGVTAGFLTFSDGSYQQVQLSNSSPTTTVPVTPRPVDQVRFTVSTVSPGASGVSFTAITLGTDAGRDDVVAGDRPDGNAAAAATFAASPEAGGADVRALQDGSGVPGAAGVGMDWVAASPTGTSVELRWDQPRELSSLQLLGSPRPSARIAAATVTFGDGARLPVGAVLADPTRPTLVAFMPRVVTSLRVTVDRVEGGGPLALAELRAYERDAIPVRAPASAGPVSAPAAGLACATPVSAVPAGLRVTCPASDSAVGAATTLRASAPGFTSVTVTVWPADGSEGPPSVQADLDTAGNAVVPVDTSAMPPGPFVVSVEANGPGRTTAQVLFQGYRPGRSDTGPPSDPPASGRTLVYDEEFDRPVALSRTGLGADYAAAKPTYSGAQDFGDAIFPDPAAGLGNVGTVEGLLRIGVQPLAPGTSDPTGAGRTHLGGLLASARPGGSGFSAQYGYFEARILAPAGPGTWPAFWMLPADNLVAPTPAVAEIDAVELYGHDPTSSCQSTHDFRDGRDGGVADCDRRFPTVRDAMGWHTYGVSVSPTENTFTVDGRVVATAPQVAGGGAPLFFLVDLALGGGWPVQLGGLGDRAALYVDYVRAYV